MAIFADKALTFLRVHACTFVMIAYGLFIVVGAVVLMILEQPEENLLVNEVRELKARFLAENPCVEESSLDRLLINVLSASKRGVGALESASNERNFDFTSSLFFVITFLTTTGEKQSDVYYNAGLMQQIKIYRYDIIKHKYFFKNRSSY